MLTKEEKALIKTLVYADIFDYPLKENELWRYFIGKKIKLYAFHQAISLLIKKKRIEYKDGFYTLKKRKFLIRERLQKEKIAVFKLTHAKQVAQWLSIVPTIHFIGVSGALAVNNAPEDDDIDFFIICAPGMLWTTRLFATLFLDLLGMRRKPGQTKFKNKICLNMFIDRSKLVLPKNERDLYSAHEVAQLKPLVNKFATYERFLKANAWALTFLPHAFSLLSLDFTKNRGVPKEISYIETKLKQFQTWYMRKRRTNEVIRSYMLRFHPHDLRSFI